jgi:parallel beta-helix repeat protein
VNYKSGRGIIMDDAVNDSQLVDNVLSNNYNCGIAIPSGVSHWIAGNKVLLLQPSSASAAGIR